MNENFKEDIGVTPSLSFDVVEENMQVQNVNEEKSIVDASTLTAEERQMVDDFES